MAEWMTGIGISISKPWGLNGLEMSLGGREERGREKRGREERGKGVP